ncbi:GGDEF domain-containing protein [Reinekea sp.]|jgi:diguanylate cyclase (GGDEF)-like protein|uniref:GGDEF domain-containing protein n=1 Tax=Reinekea sp. TaxID=1970455 RepID=UPI002A8230DC|nr:GGDEF domain-containing protein [Reinekea sp.]
MNQPSPTTWPDLHNHVSTLLVTADTAVIFFNAGHVILDANDKARQWFGEIFPQQTRLQDAWLDELGLQLVDRGLHNLTLNALLSRQVPDSYVGLSLANQTRWAQWHVLATIHQQEPCQALVLTDVSELMQSFHALQQHAEDADTRDFATRLYNRRYALERLEQMHLHAKRYQSPFAIAMVDIDHFKRINDTYGHSYGDEVLERLASVIQKSFRETDLCARFGGEEFLILMPETEINAAIFSLDRLRQQISELKWAQMQRPVTISSGVVRWQINKSVEQLVFLVDQRLGTAKKAGRNQVCGDLF